MHRPRLHTPVVVTLASLVAAAGVVLFVGGVLAARDHVATPASVGGPVVGGGDDQPVHPSTTAPSTTTAPTTAPSTTAPPTTDPSTTGTTPPPTGAPAAPTGILRPGDEGSEVAALQARLVELGYWLGEPDARYGDLTEQAVLAFQKVEGLHRDGVAGPTTLERLATATTATAASAEGDVLEVDLDRQVLLVVRGGEVREVLNVSTGSGERYRSSGGGTAVAVTPAGRFEIERRIDGYRHAPLGTLYRPAYFHGGIAFHGYTSVPAHPASHGCVRVSNAAMDHLWSAGLVEVGTAVWVH